MVEWVPVPDKFVPAGVFSPDTAWNRMPVSRMHVASTILSLTKFELRAGPAFRLSRNVRHHPYLSYAPVFIRCVGAARTRRHATFSVMAFDGLLGSHLIHTITGITDLDVFFGSHERLSRGLALGYAGPPDINRL